jgi:hypothetical protein
MYAYLLHDWTFGFSYPHKNRKTLTQYNKRAMKSTIDAVPLEKLLERLLNICVLANKD